MKRVAVAGMVTLFLGCGQAFWDEITGEADRRRVAEVEKVKREKQELVAKARSASYSLPERDIWETMYTFIVEECDIADANKRRGYIETQWRSEANAPDARWKITAEITGEEGALRVRFKASFQKKSAEGLWQDIPRTGQMREAENPLYVELYQKLSKLGKTE